MLSCGQRLLAALLLLSRCSDCQDCPRDISTVTNKENILIDELLCDYDVDRRPVLNSSEAITVNYDLIPVNIRTSEQTGGDTVTVNSWVQLEWHDEYLSWYHKPEFEDVETLRISSDKIWVPNIYLYNADTSHPSSAHDFVTDCEVRMSGGVTCAPHASHEALCDMQLSHWPYDTQTCILTLRAWVRNDDALNLTFTNYAGTINGTKGNLLLYEENPYWHMEQMNVSREGGYEYSEMVSPSIDVTFILKRHSALYDAFIIGPAIAMILMTMVSIILDMDGTDRISLLGVSILSHMLYLQQLAWAVPSSGDICPYIILFFRDSLIVTMFVLLVTSILRHRNVWSPRWMDSMAKIVFTVPGKVIMFKGFEQGDFKSIIGEGTSDENQETVTDIDQSNKKKYKLINAFANRVLFLLMTLTYLVLCLALLTSLS